MWRSNDAYEAAFPVNSNTCPDFLGCYLANAIMGAMPLDVISWTLVDLALLCQLSTVRLASH